MINADFAAFSNNKKYVTAIASPSKSKKYFDTFTEPLVDNLLKEFGGSVKIIDIACGSAHELKRFKKRYDEEWKYYTQENRVGFGSVEFVGMDISSEMLASAQKNFPFASYRHEDISKARASKVYHGVIAVNAMIYCPDRMAGYAFKSLLPGGKGSINFRPYDDERNRAFFADCKHNGCEEITTSIRVGKTQFDLKGMDYTGRNDQFKALGVQLYFPKKENIAGFLEKTGFRLLNCSEFIYAMPESDTNVTLVFEVMKKP